MLGAFRSQNQRLSAKSATVLGAASRVADPRGRMPLGSCAMRSAVTLLFAAVRLSYWLTTSEPPNAKEAPAPI
jgi:hypothetical protein